MGIGIKPAAFIRDFKLPCEFLISYIPFSVSRRHQCNMHLRGQTGMTNKTYSSNLRSLYYEYEILFISKYTCIQLPIGKPRLCSDLISIWKLVSILPEISKWYYITSAYFLLCVFHQPYGHLDYEFNHYYSYF